MLPVFMMLQEGLAQMQLPNVEKLTVPEKIEKLKDFCHEAVQARDFQAILNCTALGISLSAATSKIILFLHFIAAMHSTN